MLTDVNGGQEANKGQEESRKGAGRKQEAGRMWRRALRRKGGRRERGGERDVKAAEITTNEQGKAPEEGCRRNPWRRNEHNGIQVQELRSSANCA